MSVWWVQTTSCISGTYSMVQSPSWAANWFAASQEIPRISRNPKVHYHTHKRLPPASIPGQPNPVHIPTSSSGTVTLFTSTALHDRVRVLTAGYKPKKKHFCYCYSNLWLLSLPYQRNRGSSFLQNGGIYLHDHKKRNSSNYKQRITSLLAVKCHYSYYVSLLSFHDCLRKYVKFPHTMNISALQLENWRLWEGSKRNAISFCLCISVCTTVKNCDEHGGDSSTHDIWKVGRNFNL